MNRTSFSGPRLRGTELFGIILIVIGAAYLANNAGLIDLEWRALWPLLIVLVGAIIVFAALTNRPGTRSVGAIVPREGATDLELDLGIGGGVFHLG
ncbi:MAG TPA: DUF5668 domain-containing protein, partial [Candidatus Limnocylindrales bacterium]